MAVRRSCTSNPSNEVTFFVDGTPVMASPGDSVAAALMALGLRRLRSSPRTGAPRGAYCLMGVCQECVMRIDGRRQTACLVEVRDGMAVEAGA